MIDLTNCKCLNDIARQEFGLANYTNREKCKKILSENGIDWKEWLKEKNEKPKKHCLYCGKEIETGRRRKKFCDQSCAAKYNNRKRGNKQLLDTCYCLNCGKEMHKKQNTTKYCSITCQQEYQRKQYIEKWKNGEKNGMCGEFGISKAIRNYLIEKYNGRCQKCGWHEENPYTHTTPLEIHHIDGDYKNNREENLQLLCPNCHSLTETYKSHNKTGRKGRKRYNT